MYQFLVSFTVQPEHRDDFVRAAHRTARDSLANEPGSHRFEVVPDEENPDVLYAEGPTWLMRGELVGDKTAA
ncbi:antibiotic biosynthesis monooxygenase [Streptomyces sp. NBC_01288]|uniref:putative quinol monooxygenase n=1 Tax=Streptomyces sp. NBC_01288 TaxID=2903814 RepID=UPI002E13C9A8|nr:antibiotic biosynthesis monooxygenase [Streptomyces sp. NBC_01288]